MNVAPSTFCPREPVPPDQHVIRLLSAKRGFMNVPFVKSSKIKTHIIASVRLNMHSFNPIANLWGALC